MEGKVKAEVRSLLAALFLELIADENYSINEAFSSRYDSDTIRDVAGNLGMEDLTDKFDRLSDIYDNISSATNKQELVELETLRDEVEEQIEKEI